MQLLQKLLQCCGMKGDIDAINAYGGEYMRNYSWAEVTTGLLNEKSLNIVLK